VALLLAFLTFCHFSHILESMHISPAAGLIIGIVIGAALALALNALGA
jgi:hypothetical protein